MWLGGRGACAGVRGRGAAAGYGCRITGHRAEGGIRGAACGYDVTAVPIFKLQRIDYEKDAKDRTASKTRCAFRSVVSETLWCDYQKY